MTEPEPELPRRDDTQPVPSAWVMCNRCGAPAADDAVHQRWHDVIEGRVARVRDVAQNLRDRVQILTERIDRL